jgi:site-specific DNA-methyltransferase (adenine-specific)
MAEPKRLECYRCRAWPCVCADNICLIHGDSRGVLQQLDPFEYELLVTDPPYRVGFTGKKTKHTQYKTGGYKSFDDKLSVGPEVVTFCINRCTRAIVFPGTAAAFDYPKPADIGGVYCPSGVGLGRWGFCCFHPVLYYGGDPYLANGMGHRPNAISSFATAESNGHPCPKPMAWIRWAIVKGSCVETDTVLDPFAGSGTTLVAAKQLGRKAVGIEIEEKYCQIAAQRLRQSVFAFD